MPMPMPIRRRCLASSLPKTPSRLARKPARCPRDRARQNSLQSSVLYEQDQLRAEACDRDVTPDRPQAQGGRRGGAISLASLPCLALLLLACPAPHSRLGGWCLLVVACSLCVRDPIGSLVSLLAPDTPAGRPGSRQAKLLVALCCLTRRLTACEVGRPVGELGWPWTWRARPALEGPPRPARPPCTPLEEKSPPYLSVSR